MKNKKRKGGWQSLGEGATVLGRVVGLLFAEKMVFEQRLKWSRRELCRCLGENIPSKGNNQCKDCQEGARLLCSRKTQKASRAGTVCVCVCGGEWGAGGDAIRQAMNTDHTGPCRNSGFYSQRDGSLFFFFGSFLEI